MSPAFRAASVAGLPFVLGDGRSVVGGAVAKEASAAALVALRVLRVDLAPAGTEAAAPSVGVPSSWLIMVLGLMALGLRLPMPAGTCRRGTATGDWGAGSRGG